MSTEENKANDRRGTNQGPLFGLPATGKQITVTGITLHRFENGKAAESWFSYDALGQLQQLGVIPMPG